MKLKTIATVALIGTIYLTVVSIMIDTGIFKDIQNIVKIGPSFIFLPVGSMF